MRFLRVLVLRVLAPAAILLAGAVAAAAAPGDETSCLQAINRIEARTAMPRGLLTAVAQGESGRYDPGRKATLPWPWTVNNGGDGRYFASKAEAIAHVERLQREGRRNIDVGCMQINLMYHPDAFADLEEAFEPASNVAYGARFLASLHAESQSWSRAVERYHNSTDAERGRAYREGVYDRWQDVRLDPPLPPGVVVPQRPQLASLAAPRVYPQHGQIHASPTRGLLRIGPTRSALHAAAPARDPEQASPTRRGQLRLLSRHEPRSPPARSLPGLSPAPGGIAVTDAAPRPARPAGLRLLTRPAGSVIRLPPGSSHLSQAGD